jgi:hypothetical protein
MIWLVDGDIAPNPNAGATQKEDAPATIIELDSLDARYEAAMDRAWAHRLDHQTHKPTLQKCKFHKHQARWVAFLKTNEEKSPGITGTARNLLPTLVFGLSQMVDVRERPKGFAWNMHEVEAFARFLVHRMVSARTVMLQTAEDATRKELGTRILFKLADGPKNVRQLTRRFHRLPAQQCRESLLDLQSRGKVIYERNRWALTDT